MYQNIPVFVVVLYNTLLISECTCVNWQAFDGSTALLLAAQNGFIDAIQLLVTHKADVNKPDNMQITPLFACK